MVFEGLDGSFRGVHMMVCWLYKLPRAIFFLEIGLEWRGGLVVGHIEGRFVPLVGEVCEDLIERFDDAGVGQVFHWTGKDGIDIVVVRDKIVLVPFKADRWECSYGIRVQGACLFVHQRGEAKNIV